MPAWNRRLKKAASEWLSLPPDAMETITRVTILDGREVIVEHIAGLIHVDERLIEIDLGHAGLRIVGEAFEVNLASDAEVHLSGQIAQLQYVRREDLSS